MQKDQKMKKNSLTPSYYAFFDVDETVISLKSMFDFLHFYYQSLYPKTKANALYQKHFKQLKDLAKRGLRREEVNKSYYQLYKGHSFSNVKKIGREWFNFNKNHNLNFYHACVLNEIKKHKQSKAGIVLVSGSFESCLKPIQEDIGADEVLCIQPEEKEDILTGHIIGIQTIGEGKASAIKNFLKEHSYENTQNCYAYGDHISDLPMLSLVGKPLIYPNCPKLIEHAKKHRWPILG